VRLDTYEARTSPWLTVLAFVFLAVYGTPVVWQDLPRGLVAALEAANVVIWCVFAADLSIRVALAEHRWRWLARHPVDVLAVLVPMLRPLRVLRVLTAGHSLLTRRGGLLRTGNAVVLSAAVLVLVGALAELDAERGAPGATITSIGDALWWAMTTVTTVGYGDLYPVTGLGRIVAAALMVVGISVLGVITAAVAAWFVQMTRDTAEEATGEAVHLATSGGELPDPHRAALRALWAAGVLTDAEVRTAIERLPA
jgi:voltage-gated potassium channel